MNFQNLNNIETYKEYLDIAFNRAKNKARDYKQKSTKKDPVIKCKESEISRINSISDTLNTHLLKILTSYPSIDSLPDFYRELIKCTLDYPELKKSLGALNWVTKKIAAFSKLYINKIRKCQNITKIQQFRKEYYGRISSVMKQIRSNLSFLEEARKIMKSYPAIKTSLFTVAIVGFPNVGKTTLLYKLTGSKPEINRYAFTTTSVNQGFIINENKKIQLLDTPGTLNRFNTMNNIEKISFLAMKYCANLLIYVYDLTEPYPLKDQVKLHENLKDQDKEILVYLSKKDLIDESQAKFKHIDIKTIASTIIERAK